MFKKLIGMIARAVDERRKMDSIPCEPRATSRMEQLFGDCTPAIVAFKIDNGYVVRSVQMGPAYDLSQASGFTYCKDHQAIADHIITESARDKVFADKQLSLKYGAAANPSHSTSKVLIR